MIFARSTSRNSNRNARCTPRPKSRRTAFTLTELLVVIGIVVLLIGILLAALSSARNKALATKTLATMNGFSQAAQTYQLEHGKYPGLVPERVLAAMTGQEITSMESAILALMGGARVLSPQDVAGTATRADYDNYNGEEIVVQAGNQEWKIKIDVNRIGEGPYVAGKTYSPYYQPSESELTSTHGVQTNEIDAGDGSVHIVNMPDNYRLPDLIDGWGQPILFARRVRSIGPLVGESSANPQFLFDTSTSSLVGTSQYTKSTKIGAFEVDQTDATSEQYSILQIGSASDQQATWEQILAHPSLPGEARGAFILISAGADGIYFSRMDGPGSPKEIIGDDIGLPQFRLLGPSIIEEFDDVRVFGGN